MSYDAFISYDHGDGDVAAAVQKALHRIAKPLLQLRALRVFRDTTGLPPNQPLPDSLEAAIRASNFLILIASPASAASPWVRKEVATLLAGKESIRLILILAAGELAWDAERNAFHPEKSTALAPQLHDAFEREPLWIDLREARSASRLTLRNPAFRTALVAVAAPLHKKSPDQLDTEDHRLQRRTRRIATAVAVVLLLVSANWFRASMERAREEDIRRANELSALAAAVHSNDLQSRTRKGLLAIQALHRFRQRGLRSADADEPLRDVLSFLPKVRHDLDPGLRSIHALAFTDDGNELIVAGRDTLLVRIRVENGVVDTVSRPGFYARSATLSPDGRFAVSADYNPNPPGHWLQVYDARSGERKGEPIPGGRLYAIAPGVRFLATVHEQTQQETVIWDLVRRRIVARLPFAGRLSFSRNGQHLALAGIRASLWRIDTTSADGVSVEEVWEDRWSAPGGSAVFSADGAQLAATGTASGLRIGTIGESGFRRNPMSATQQPSPGALSRSGRFTAEVTGYDVTVRELQTGRAVRIPHGEEVASYAFSPRDDLLAVAGISGRVVAWSILNTGVMETDSALPFSGVLSFVADTTLLVVVRGQTRLLGTGSTVPPPVRSLLIDLDGMTAGPERMHQSGLFSVSPDGGFLAVLDTAGTVTVIRTIDGQDAGAVTVGAEVRSIVLGEQAERLAALLPQAITVFDVRSGNRIHRYAHDAEVVAVAASRNRTTGWLRDQWLENPGTRGERPRDSIAIVDLSNGRTLRTTDPTVQTTTIGPLGRRLIWQSQSVNALSPTVRVETLEDSTVRSYPGGFAAVSGDGDYLATLDQGRVRIWDLNRGEIARIPNELTATPVLSPGARYLAVLSGGRVSVWPLEPDDLIRIACAELGARDLSEEEWGALVPEIAFVDRACG